MKSKLVQVGAEIGRLPPSLGKHAYTAAHHSMAVSPGPGQRGQQGPSHPNFWPLWVKEPTSKRGRLHP